MGDRTFSAEDVIRLYQDFLLSDEQETVEEFFKELLEEEPQDISAVFEGLRILQELFRQLVEPLSPILVFVLNRFAFFIAAVSTIQFVLTRIPPLLDELLALEEVDA